jgi:hypothetical protein
MKIWFALLEGWEWVKKNWMWLLFPVGVAIFLFGRCSKKTKQVEVVAPELLGAAETRLAEDDLAEQERAAARAELAEQVRYISQEHAEVVMELNDEQRRKAESLLDDPGALNDFLLRVGREQRGE